MSIQSEMLLDELEKNLSDYANHIDFLVQRIGSNENIQIYNGYHNSTNDESICVQAMIYKIYRDYSEKLNDYDEAIPDDPQIMNIKAIINNINKKGIRRFIEQNDLTLPFFALLAKAKPYTKPLTSFEDKKLLQNFMRKSDINYIKHCIRHEKYYLESIEKGTWKTIRDNIKTLDSLKF